MAGNKPIRRECRLRHGHLSFPVTIGLVLAGVIAVIFLLNWLFYGQAVAITEQRIVLADIADFSQFVRECSDDPASSDEIITMRDEPDGNFLFLRLQLLLSFVYDKKGTHTGQIILRNNDFSLRSGGQTMTPVLLSGGYLSRADGREELVIRSLALRRSGDGSIEQAEADSGEKATLGAVVRGVKELHAAAGVGSGGARRGVLDWVRAPLEERSRIIQPSALSGDVWRAELSQNKQEAWRAAEAVCLFPLPAPESHLTLVVFGDDQAAIPITLQ